MTDFLEYVKWRADLPLFVDSLNEIDLYILCKFGCLYLSNIMNSSDVITIHDAFDAYKEYLSGQSLEENLGPLASPALVTLLKKIPYTKRYGDLQLKEYILATNEETSMVFSALTILLPGNISYITFRGTGDTIASWKEDFLLSVEDEIPAQKEAVEYLNFVAQKCTDSLIIGGHSKGGNLAVYASLETKQEIKNRIIGVYNFDGPGFRQDIEELPEFQYIRPILHTYMAQHAIVGRLLNQVSNRIIVESAEPGLLAHDGLNWDIEVTKFKRAENYSTASDAIAAAFKETLENMSKQEQMDFIKEFFSILTCTGATTLSDLTEHRVLQVIEISTAMRRSPKVISFIRSLASIIFHETVSSISPLDGIINK